MSERIANAEETVANGPAKPRLVQQNAQDEGGLRAPPGLSPLGKLWWWCYFLILVKLARLRFIAILLAVGLVIINWDTLKAYYEKWVRPASLQPSASSDTEFWCSMHPTIVRDHPDKCPICGMPLSKRKKRAAGEDDALPAGRVQLTPYRMTLAGLQTSEVRYQRLNKEILTVGSVEFDERKLARISARLPGKSRIDKLFVNFTGQMVRKGDPLALLYNPDLVVTLQNLVEFRRTNNRELERMAQSRLKLWGIEEDQVTEALRIGKDDTRLIIRAPIGGHVIKRYQVEGEYVEEGARLYDMVDLSSVWIEAQVFEDDLGYLKEDMTVSASAKAFPNQTFTGKIAFIQPHLDANTRTLSVRFDMSNLGHELRPGMYATVKLETPMTELGSFAKALADEWRERTAMDGLSHSVLAPGGTPAGAGLEPLLEAAVGHALMQHGLVLTVPESAVIDTGSRKLVYREAWPGVYDGVEVQLGPRSRGVYSVLRGLQSGDKVATAGSFLLDAETRLTGGVGSTYFGASGGPASDRRSGATETRPSQGEDEAAKAKAVLAKLSRVDRQLAEAQGFCPVLNNRLGAMGLPAKILLEGQPVFLCCKGCEKEAREDSARTLARVAELKSVRTGAARPLLKAPTTAAKEQEANDAKVQANLAKLNAEDRSLAAAQRFCAVQGANRLGAMGVPFKVMIQGQPIFLCCDGCADEARAQPERTLARVRELRARANKVPPSGAR